MTTAAAARARQSRREWKRSIASRSFHTIGQGYSEKALHGLLLIKVLINGHLRESARDSLTGKSILYSMHFQPIDLPLEDVRANRRQPSTPTSNVLIRRIAIFCGAKRNLSAPQFFCRLAKPVPSRTPTRFSLVDVE